MFNKLKLLFPRLYSNYQHFQRRKVIRNINKLKKLPEDKYPAIIDKAYKKAIGQSICWENPTRYTEKMQWEKIYNKDPRKTKLADKYLVRGWVERIIGKEYLIPLLGVWNNFEEIDFSQLPSQFVLKTNHGTGTNVIVKDKEIMDYEEVKCRFKDWLDTDFAYTNYFQLHYSKIERKIIAEEYLETDRGELQDYKFLCFNGKPYFCWVDLGRFSEHTRTVFDMDWIVQPWSQYYNKTSETLPRPYHFEKMKEIATLLSSEFSQVRVDLYNVDGKIYFGEMTFTNGSGLDPIIPDEYDSILGSYWTIPDLARGNAIEKDSN